MTPVCIEITLIKDNEYGSRWNQLEPNEYSESRPNIQLSPTIVHPLSTTNTNLITNNSNRGKHKDFRISFFLTSDLIIKFQRSNLFSSFR